ncbi:MAG: hypothetical protein QOI69_1375 [Pseudonocardiales bacterium]|nr:hypothetical protein [Pseudonocardiales bacterium]
MRLLRATAGGMRVLPLVRMLDPLHQVAIFTVLMQHVGGAVRDRSDEVDKWVVSLEDQSATIVRKPIPPVVVRSASRARRNGRPAATLLQRVGEGRRE